MEPPSEQRQRDAGMPQYGLQSDGLDGYSRMHDASVGQVAGQSWQHHGQPTLASPVPAWNNAFQPPSRQLTPNSTPHFDQPTFSHYSNGFGAESPAASALHQPVYHGWNGFNPSQFGNNNLDPSLAGAAAAAAAAGRGLTFEHQPQQQQRQHFHSPAAFQHTVAPSALENVPDSQFQVPRADGPPHPQAGPLVSDVPQKSFQVDLPPGAVQGSFLIIPEDGLAMLTESKSLSQFLNIGVEAQEFLRASRSSTTPAAPRRKSRNAIKELASSDPKLLAKLAKGKPKSKSRSQIKAQKIPAPRLPLARAASAISTPSSVDSSSEDDSEYDSSEDDLDIIESPPYADRRPDDPAKAVAYDTIRAVWLPRRKQPTPDQIREGLRAFWEVLSTIRNRWKSDTETLKKAEDAKRNSEVPMLKDRVKSQRVMLEAALTAALEHGHPEILRLMGENRPFLQMSYVFMVDRVKDSDTNGTLSRQLLKILVRCTTITREALEEFKLKKVLAIYTRRGDDEISMLVKQVDEVAAAASKEKAEKAKSAPAAPSKDASASAPPKAAGPPANRLPQPAPVAGVKRAQPGDAPGIPAKRPMNASAGQSKATGAAPKGSPVTSEKKPALPAAPKTAISTAKPVNMYAGLKAASKKPGTALLEKKLNPAVQATEKKAAPAPGAKASAAPAWSFKDYMADLSKPKEPEKPKEKKVERGPESEEERRKRERKEARRGLRVQFKTGSALEEVRVFEHDPEEESGHDASMTRDVGDVQSEGRMFKQHMEQMDLDGEMDMDIDDDNEHQHPSVERLIDYSAPWSVDFDVIDNQQRLTNYYKSGGYKHAVSKERDLQDKHESNTLLAVYLSSTDVPPNPREPADPYDGEHIDETKDFGPPPPPVQNRASLFDQQHGSRPWPSTAPTIVPATSGSTPDLNAILASLSGHGSTTQQLSQAAPATSLLSSRPDQQVQGASVPTGFENLFATFQKFSQPSQGQTPQQQQAAAQPAPQTAPAADLGALLASLQGQQTTSQPAAAIQPQVPVQLPFANMNTQQPNAPGLPQDWATMMAAWAQAGVLPPPMPGMPPLPDFSLPAQDTNASGGYEHPDRKRMLDGSNDEDAGSKKSSWDNGKKKWTKEKPKFVLPCRFYKEGKCTKGAACTYVHD